MRLALIIVAAIVVGVSLPVLGLYVLTYRPTGDDRESVSTAWQKERLRGRRE